MREWIRRRWARRRRVCSAQAGLRVEVFEAEAEPGGAARTLGSLPGFMHDFGSAVHHFAAGSPFFTSLPLAVFGLEWVHGEAPLARPLDDGAAGWCCDRGPWRNRARLGRGWKDVGSALCSPPSSLTSSRHVPLSQTNFRGFFPASASAALHPPSRP